jgi:hypothetical protein
VRRTRDTCPARTRPRLDACGATLHVATNHEICSAKNDQRQNTTSGHLTATTTQRRLLVLVYQFLVSHEQLRAHCVCRRWHTVGVDAGLMHLSAHNGFWPCVTMGAHSARFPSITNLRSLNVSCEIAIDREYNLPWLESLRLPCLTRATLTVPEPECVCTFLSNCPALRRLTISSEKSTELASD